MSETTRARRRCRTGAVVAVAGPAVVGLSAGGRLALLVFGAAVLLILAVVAALAFGASFAGRAEQRDAARRTLLLLLRLAPWYR
ncbi:hypothetical protein GCM10009716_00050 [Streptomyces sodiiphilus]|uniref:Sensor histidine kinase n=1 Tax=Streptomyces sodiiphilus TaxID=226217 RepID=A0ABN2NQ24_9ACTN